MQRLVDPSLADQAKTELLQEQQVLRASKRQPLAQLQHTEA
jgi:hypothetical protein